MKHFALIAMVLSAFTLAACDTAGNYTGPQINKQTAGAGGGAILGGILGSRIGGGNGQLWATGAGVLLGAFIGSEIGKSLDKADMNYMEGATREAQSAPVGEPISWSNPESGNSGEVKATRDGYTASGRYCREFQQTIYIDGREESAFGTACQQPDGSWQIVNASE